MRDREIQIQIERNDDRAASSPAAKCGADTPARIFETPTTRPPLRVDWPFTFGDQRIDFGHASQRLQAAG